MKAAALLGFAPFAAFVLFEKLIGIAPGLAAGLTVSLGVVAWEALRHRSANILELGSAAIFASLTILAFQDEARWSVWEVRLYVDGALATIVFLSVLLRRPFTMQQGKKMVAAEVVCDPQFLRHNTILSAAWGLAFTALTLVDIYMSAHSGASDRVGIIVTLAVLGVAAHFTRVYLKRVRAGIERRS